MAKVKDIAMQIRGVSYHPEDLHDNLDEDSVVLLRANNIKDGKLILDDVVYVSKSKVAEQQYLQTGDILICASSGSKELVGKAAFVDSVKNPMTFGAFCKVVRPQPEYSEYLGHYFNSPVYRRKISALSAGANINNIKNEHIDNLDIQLVDEKERREIITILNELNMLIFLRKQQLFKLDELVKARFVEMFGDDIYPKVKVSRVCDFITKGTTPPNNLISEKYSSDKVPYLKVYNLSFTGKLLFDTAPQYVPENIHNGVLARSKVYPNDVLMNIVGPPLGKFALVTDEFSEWNINQAIAIFRAKEKVNPKYLLFALMQPEVLKPFLRQAVGIRQLNLSLAQCRDLEIPLPPLSLQSEFAAFVERVDQQKQTVQQSLEKLELMKKALMQKYFG